MSSGQVDIRKGHTKVPSTKAVSSSSAASDDEVKDRMAARPNNSSSQRPIIKNQLSLLMYVIGGRVGQVTVFNRPISLWKLDLTKTF
jgi:hypothetical protein